MTPLRITLKILFFILWSLLIVPPQGLFVLIHRGPLSYKLPRLWHRGLCAAFGLRIKVIGTPLPTTEPVMFVSNHISWLDIMAMGSVLEASFVAKKDVRSWPVAGYLATLQQTAFISRSSKDALKEKNSLESYLRRGQSMIIFPEGTTTDGKTMLPFKSSLFALALDHHLTGGKLKIQPFTLRAVPDTAHPERDGAPIYPWYGDMTLLPHLLGFFGSRGCQIELIFHAPLTPQNHGDRKAISRLTQTMVEQGLATGQSQPLPPQPSRPPEPQETT